MIMGIILFVACDSSKRAAACQELKNRKPLNVNSYKELLNYDVKDKREVSLLVLDGRVANEDILNHVVFNQSGVDIIEIISVISSDGSNLDGEPKRSIIISTNLCRKWQLKKTE